jgi:hypothetical protein
MDYYQCTKIDLHHELTRRGLQAYGDQDEAAERLKQDDDRHGSIATMVDAMNRTSNDTWRSSPEFGKTVVASMLINEGELGLLLSSFLAS